MSGNLERLGRQLAHEASDEYVRDRALPGLGDAGTGHLIGDRPVEVRGEPPHYALFGRDLYAAEVRQLVGGAMRLTAFWVVARPGPICALRGGPAPRERPAEARALPPASLPPWAISREQTPCGRVASATAYWISISYLSCFHVVPGTA